MVHTPPLSCLAFLLLAAVLVTASSGDRAREFGDCVVACQSQRCEQFEALKSLSLKITRWTCTDDCKYTCMHDITDKAVTAGRGIQQYYGKWPFWRFAGMQEPASVMFSLFNLWSHFIGYKQVRRKVSASHPMRPFYLLWSILSMNAWFWSAIFHTRGVLLVGLRRRCVTNSDSIDTPVTEKLDYFSAALAILNALFYTVIRLLRIYQPPRPKLTAGPALHAFPRLLTLLFVGVYSAHIY